ncbi:MAG: glycosyltransferase, partial [Candidatus Melainabacteria bacterium HGW-Melainabacteria-1]
MSLAVIILTSPGREANLVACLQALKAQTLQGFELIVVDDGSEQGEAVVRTATAGWLDPLYLWRPNDYNM